MTTVITVENEELIGTGSIDTLETTLGGLDNFWGTIVDASLQIVKFTPDGEDVEQHQRKLVIEMRADAGWPTTLKFNMPTDKATGEPEMVERDGKLVAKGANKNSDWGKFTEKLAGLGVPSFKTASELRGLHVRIMSNTIPGFKGGPGRNVRLPMETDGYDNDFRQSIGLPAVNITSTRETSTHQKSLEDLVGRSWMEYKAYADKERFPETFTRGEVTKLIDSGVLVEVAGKYEKK